MTINMENDQASGETPGQGDTSGSTGAQPSAVDYKKLADALRPVIAEEVGRRTQSDKDSRIAKLTSKVDTFAEQLKRLDELKADGMTEKAALKFMDFEDRLPQKPEAQNQSQTPLSSSVGAGGTAASESTKALTIALGLDANDPEVTEVLRQNEFSAQVDLLVTLADKRKKALEAPTNPAQQMPVGGGSAINQPDKEVIAAELIRLSNELPSKNYKQIQALNEKLKTIK